MYQEIKLAERKSNNTIDDSVQRWLLNRIETKLLKKVKEIIGKLRIITMYEYDDIDINIKHKIKL
jgi:hypothetical protein